MTKFADDMPMAELPGVPPPPAPKKKRGRPPTGTAKSHAERQEAYRQRQAAKGRDQITVDISQDVQAALAKYIQFKLGTDGNPLTLGEAMDRILRDRLLRPR